MNAITAIAPHVEHTLALDLPAHTPFPDWVALGRSLATQKRHVDWLIGDWITFGRKAFPEQIDLALADVSDDPRNLKRIERTAAAFPPHLRSTSLSFDHHAHLADMPTQDALPLLREAEEQNLAARELRKVAMLRKLETGQIMVDDDDPENDMLKALAFKWNRATRTVRQEFADMIAESDLGVIEV